MENSLDMRFGRCEYFQIHDSESKKVKILENERPKCKWWSRYCCI